MHCLCVERRNKGIGGKNYFLNIFSQCDFFAFFFPPSFRPQLSPIFANAQKPIPFPPVHRTEQCDPMRQDFGHFRESMIQTHPNKE
jgi:hypothetical protein